MKKYFFLIFTLSICSFAASCSERENPLSKIDQGELAKWIYQKNSEDIEFCSSKWANRSDAKKDELQDCEIIAGKLAGLLKDGGFGDVTTLDVQLPTLWQEYTELLKAARANTYDPQKASEAFKLAPPRRKN